jgi:hypothetical protein
MRKMQEDDAEDDDDQDYLDLSDDDDQPRSRWSNPNKLGQDK